MATGERQCMKQLSDQDSAESPVPTDLPSTCEQISSSDFLIVRTGS